MFETALVLGAGISGEAAARLLLREGTSVTVWDQATVKDIGERAETITAMGARVVAGQDAPPPGPYDICVISPGVDSELPFVKAIEAGGTAVISELELGYRHCACPILAITGTNGKSTVVKLCHDALEQSGKKTCMAGNYGTPLSMIADQTTSLDWAVVEVSSFQLEKVERFRPRVGVLLNIRPDHLDRHGDMATYGGLKMRMFENMECDDVAIVPEAGGSCEAPLVPGQARKVLFGVADASQSRYGDHQVTCESCGANDIVDLRGTLFDNPMLGVNAAAAGAAVIACGGTAESVSTAAAKFVSLPHRMETVCEIGGVRFVDDSKATNLAALIASVEASERPVRLIAGGLLKEKDLEIAKEVLAKKSRGVYLIGAAADEMKKAWGSIVPCKEFDGLARAVEGAWEDACEGETVLLAPGCASFDQFRSYHDRGVRYRKAVEEICDGMST